MTKEQQEKYLDPLWQRKKTEIQIRDNFTCMQCNAQHRQLHVHHNYYELNKDPWDYPDLCFYLLCDICHKEEHDIQIYVKNELFLSFKKFGFTNKSLLRIIDGLSYPKGLPAHPDLVAECVGRMFYGNSIPIVFADDYERMDAEAVDVKFFMEIPEEDRPMLLSYKEWDGIEAMREWYNKKTEDWKNSF
jgi:hypothetical protein